MKTPRAKTRAQLTTEYGISPRTLRRWLHREQLPISSGLLCPKEQALIYQALGKPQASD